MENIPIQSPPDPLRTRFESSGKAWKRFGMAIGSITPSMLGRALLVFGAAGALIWLSMESWPALAPFIVGAVMAYIILPLVNILDRMMPRVLAALLAVLFVLGAIGMLLWTIVPPLVSQSVALVRQIPPDTTLKDISDALILRLQFLPPSIRIGVADAITSATTRMQGSIRTAIPMVFSSNTILRFLNAIGFILGLIVLPTWLLTVLKDTPRAKRVLGSGLPSGIRADFWAVLRIFDRAFGVFFRGQVLVGMVVGLATYLGLNFLTRLGAPESPYLVTFAVLAGLLQLIPEIGPLLNILLGVLIAFKISSTLALYVLALYLGIQFLVGRWLKDRIEQRIIDVNPALLVIVIVALSQLGFFWLFLAAPVAGVARDLFRYVYGRVSEPPRPAGVMPGEPLPTYVGPQPLAPSRRRAPMIYRRMQTRPGRGR